MAQADLDKVPSIMQVGEYQACIFHLLALSTCKRCDQVGHRPSDPKCPAKAMDLMMDTVETFRGGKCQLSNLHTCPEGCVIEDKGTTFPSSEHHYQFKKLKHHDKGIILHFYCSCHKVTWASIYLTTKLSKACNLLAIRMTNCNLNVESDKKDTVNKEQMCK